MEGRKGRKEAGSKERSFRAASAGRTRGGRERVHKRFLACPKVHVDHAKDLAHWRSTIIKGYKAE